MGLDANAEIFRNLTSDDTAVLRATARIPAGGAPAHLWTDVANDPEYRPFHRAVAVYELLKRQFAVGATLGELSSLLAGGGWLLDAAIEKVTTMGGEIPLAIPPLGAAFVIRMPIDAGTAHPEIGAYLTVDRDLDAGELRDALMSRSTEPAVVQTRLGDLALFPENLAEAWYQSSNETTG
jgi:hypothetical protein